jgi:hypothetical protein
LNALQKHIIDVEMSAIRMLFGRYAMNSGIILKWKINSDHDVKVSRPATRHGGVWGGRRYNSSFLTTALDGGEWSASRLGCALSPGNGPPVPIAQEAEWAPEPVWTQGLEEKSSASVGDRTPIVQSAVRH